MKMLIFDVMLDGRLFVHYDTNTTQRFQYQ